MLELNIWSHSQTIWLFLTAVFVNCTSRMQNEWEGLQNLPIMHLIGVRSYDCLQTYDIYNQLIHDNVCFMTNRIQSHWDTICGTKFYFSKCKWRFPPANRTQSNHVQQSMRQTDRKRPNCQAWLPLTWPLLLRPRHTGTTIASGQVSI